MCFLSFLALLIVEHQCALLLEVFVVDYSNQLTVVFVPFISGFLGVGLVADVEIFPLNCCHSD